MIETWKGMKVVGLYASKNGGFVIAVEDTDELHPSGKRYDAYWSDDMHYATPLGGGSIDFYTPDTLMEWLRAWDSKLSPIEDLGDVEMFFRRTKKGGYTVSLKFDQFNYITDLILARDVPTGAFLLSDAANFFRTYKGESWVREQGNLQVLVEPKPKKQKK